MWEGLVSVPIAGISRRKACFVALSLATCYVSVPIAGISRRKEPAAFPPGKLGQGFSPDRRD
ncbi:hypothetical protein MYO_4190 (plasmid) [Synechocystis sp. PCC 6803]|nr:hypothetical protein MYO_4190 [Synechocystis sp. PCC 6803]